MCRTNRYRIAHAALLFFTLLVHAIAAAPHAAHKRAPARVHAVVSRNRKRGPCTFTDTRAAYKVTCPSGLTPNPVATVVTSYLHTPAKRETAIYLQRMQKFFELQASVVAYIDYAYVHTAQRMVHRPDAVVIVPVTFSQFRTLSCGLGVWQHEHDIDIERAVHAPTLYPVWAEKATMVAQAARANCFGSDLFVWLDVGYFSGVDVPASPFPAPDAMRWLPADKVLLLGVNVSAIADFAEAYQRAGNVSTDGVGNFKRAVTLAAGGFGGSLQAVLAWEAAYIAMLDRYRAQGWFAGKEQNLFTTMCVETPGICAIHDSQFRWYDVVPLLSGTMQYRDWTYSPADRRLRLRALA